MRILSEFHDYYDSVQGIGQDQTLIYLRKPAEVEVRYSFPILPANNRFGYRNLTVHQSIIGFCGKIYPVLKLIRRSRASLPDDVYKICYNLDDVDLFVRDHYPKKVIEEYQITKSKKKRRYRFRFWQDVHRYEFEKFFLDCANIKDAHTNMFLERRCPIFVATLQEASWYRPSKAKIVYNASLREFEFFRIFDTYSAFQEIAMYLGGLAAPNKPIPEVSDRDMITAKGFDEFSFRKEKKT
jgi:hypothetical protein